MQWLSNPNNLVESTSEIEPRCLINISGCAVQLFGICFIVKDLPID